MGLLHERASADRLRVFHLSGAGEVYGTCWALWGFDTFHWNGLWIGLSLGTFGVCQTLVQALLPGPATKLFGDRGAVLVGIACSLIALVVMAFANQGWIIFAIMPIFALTGLGTPALQSLATRQVDATRQGQFQGVLASAVSLASIVGPLTFSTFYFVVQKTWPGAIWLSVIRHLCNRGPVGFSRHPDPNGFHRLCRPGLRGTVGTQIAVKHIVELKWRTLNRRRSFVRLKSLGALITAVSRAAENAVTPTSSVAAPCAPFATRT